MGLPGALSGLCALCCPLAGGRGPGREAENEGAGGKERKREIKVLKLEKD